MAYREHDTPQKTGNQVAVRSYLDLTMAQLALQQLQSEGIPGFVVEATAFNPLLAGLAGGHRVMIDEADVPRAHVVLKRGEAPTSLADDEPAGTVRCPRCELVYCRQRFHLRSLGTRWICDRCDHVWRDAKEGPATATLLAEGEPTPVFLLYRGNGAAGAFIGLFLGVGALVALPRPYGFLALVAMAVGGSYAGRLFGKYVCSEPACHKELAANADHCAACNGTVAGTIRYLGEHYSASADVRRNLSRARESAPKKLSARTKKKPAKPADE